jgi:aspartate-semialdehyde dehydrogenase
MVFLCASAEVSRDIAPIARAAGALVIDNSSAFRLQASVPLVVPEINSERLPRSAQGALIANPNCSTIILLTALEPLRRKFGIRSIQVSTYQAVSGAGQRGMDELLKQVNDFAQGKTSSPVAFAEPCLFNVFSHDSEVDEQTGLNGEEQKIIDESRKIWSDPALAITPTCVRVPVLRAHTQAISIELQEPATYRELQDAWASSAAVRVIDNRAANKFPTPLQATGSDAVLVGRLRADHAGLSDPSRPHPSRTTRWSLLACGDQLRKGAALNAVQIAEQIQF